MLFHDERSHSNPLGGAFSDRKVTDEIIGPVGAWWPRCQHLPIRNVIE